MNILMEELANRYSQYLKKYTKDQLVFTDRSLLEDENIVVSGSMIEISSTGGKEASTLLYRKGDVFGRLRQESLKVFKTIGVAKTDMQVLSIPEKIFQKALDSDLELKEMYLASLENMFTRLQNKFCSLAIYTPSQRLVSFLIRVQGNSYDGKIHMTTDSIALTLSTTRQTVSKTINYLKKQGLLQSSYKTIVLLDIEKIKNIYGLS